MYSADSKLIQFPLVRVFFYVHSSCGLYLQQLSTVPSTSTSVQMASVFQIPLCATTGTTVATTVMSKAVVSLTPTE